jgi:hypothetical protein
VLSASGSRNIEINPVSESFSLISPFSFQSIATIAIYLIVLLQFKLSLISQQMPAHLTIAAQQLLANKGDIH